MASPHRGVLLPLQKRRQLVTSCCSLTEVADRPEAVLGLAAFASQSEPWGERDGLRAGLMRCHALLCWASLVCEDTRGGAELWSKGTKPSATPQHGSSAALSTVWARAQRLPLGSARVLRFWGLFGSHSKNCEQHGKLSE